MAHELTPALSSLLDLHARMDAVFLQHQTALLDRDLPAAARHLADYAALLRQHIADEEAHVLPAYEQSVQPAPEGGKAEFFRFEHQKLDRTLDELKTMLDELAQSAAPTAPAGILALLDRETSFKDLLAHHDARERNFLYPLLDQHLPEAERARILSAVELR